MTQGDCSILWQDCRRQRSAVHTDQIQIDWCVIGVWRGFYICGFQFEVVAPSCVLIPPGSCGDIVKHRVSELVGMPASDQTVMSGPGS